MDEKFIETLAVASEVSVFADQPPALLAFTHSTAWCMYAECLCEGVRKWKTSLEVVFEYMRIM